MDLEAKRDSRVLKLSGGQQRRLDVAIALAGNPDLLFLDEPTTGFDPSARHEAWEVIKNLAALGKTVLLTTHYMEEAQYLADQVAVISNGQIVAEGHAGHHREPGAGPGQDPLPAAGGGHAARRPHRGARPGRADRTGARRPDRHLAPAHRLGAGPARGAHRAGGHPALAGGRLSEADRRCGRAGRAAGRGRSGPQERMAQVMNTAALTLSQVRYVNKAFWRNPASAFFIFAFPLMFLVIFTALLGHGTLRISPTQVVNVSTYYVAAMASFGVISACYTNIAISVSFQRDTGVLKRINGTPLPSSAFLGARMVQALLVAILLVVITAAFGRVFYSASVPAGLTLLRFLVMLLVGAASFCALGFAITAVIPNADAAPAIVNASILPLLFLSGVFIPLGSNAPAWIVWIARIFPVWHFAKGMQAGFLGTAFSWTDVLVVAAWGLGGLLFAIRFFSWEPRT